MGHQSLASARLTSSTLTLNDIVYMGLEQEVLGRQGIGGRRKHGAGPPRVTERLPLFGWSLPGHGGAVIIPRPISLLENTCASVLRNHFWQVNVAVQFGSHVFPPSAENDCSVRNDVGVTSENTNRTRIDLP